MNARVFFGLTIAVLLGLGAAVVAKITGIFEKKPPPPPEPAQQVQVVVARKNLYEGYGIGPNMVTVRRISKNSQEYQKVKGKHFEIAPATYDRVALRDINAGAILLRNDLSEQKIPDPIKAPEGMVAVNVDVLKEDALGGNIRRGQRVDVILTSRIFPPGRGSTGEIRSAVLAQNLDVLTVNNRLIDVLEQGRRGQPIPFTLAASPYRAALIRQAKFKGTVSLQQATRPSEQTTIEDKAKSEQLLAGKLAIGNKDFVELFHVTTIEAAVPPPELRTRHILGLQDAGSDTFREDGTRYLHVVNGKKGDDAGPSGVVPADYVFADPEARRR